MNHRLTLAIHLSKIIQVFSIVAHHGKSQLIHLKGALKSYKIKWHLPKVSSNWLLQCQLNWDKYYNHFKATHPWTSLFEPRLGLIGS